MDLNKIGKLIATLRKKKRLTQSQLGEMLGVGDKAVSKWERGINAPDISLLKPLCDILEITISELLSGEKNEKSLNFEILNFYTKLTQQKLLKRSIVVFLILIIIFLTIFIINNYNRFQVYKISSMKENFVVDGYMIFNKEKNILMITKIEYIDKYIGTDKEIIVKRLDIFLKSDKFIIQRKTIEGEDKEKFSLMELLEKSYLQIDELFIDDEKSLTNNILDELTIEIQYLDLEDKNYTIVIPLKIEKEISNDKLFY